MKIHILQHVSFESPGVIMDWVQKKGFSPSFTRFFMDEPLPKVSDFDLLVILGGPMGISEEEKYPWLKEEKQFIKDCLRQEKKIIGICLGAQLLANAIGAKVYKNPEKEIGWFPIEKVPGVNHPVLMMFPGISLQAFHWHADTFSLPQNAIPLFSSAATKIQAFIANDKWLGLQFHWEVKPENIQQLFIHAKNDLTPGKFVQQPEVMLKNPDYFYKSNISLFHLLDYFIP